MTDASATLQGLSDAAAEYGKTYVSAVEAGDDARALRCAQQLLVRFAEAVPNEDDGHRLMANILFALQEVAAGKFESHPILRGRYPVGGVGQVSALQEHVNGLGAAVMEFLTQRNVSQHAAAKMVGRTLGVGATAPKNWVSDPKRKLLKAMASPSLARLESDFAEARVNEPFRFAEKWLQENAKLMLTLSPG